MLLLLLLLLFSSNLWRRMGRTRPKQPSTPQAHTHTHTHTSSLIDSLILNNHADIMSSFVLGPTSDDDDENNRRDTAELCIKVFAFVTSTICILYICWKNSTTGRFVSRDRHGFRSEEQPVVSLYKEKLASCSMVREWKEKSQPVQQHLQDSIGKEREWCEWFGCHVDIRFQ